MADQWHDQLERYCALDINTLYESIEHTLLVRAKIPVSVGDTEEIQLSGGTIYTKNGKLHSQVGPAVIKLSGDHIYYIEGIQMQLSEWSQYSTLTDVELASLLFIDG